METASKAGNRLVSFLNPRIAGARSASATDTVVLMARLSAEGMLPEADLAEAVDHLVQNQPDEVAREVAERLVFALREQLALVARERDAAANVAMKRPVDVTEHSKAERERIARLQPRERLAAAFADDTVGPVLSRAVWAAREEAIIEIEDPEAVGDQVRAIHLADDERGKPVLLPPELPFAHKFHTQPAEIDRYALPSAFPRQEGDEHALRPLPAAVDPIAFNPRVRAALGAEVRAILEDTVAVLVATREAHRAEETSPWLDAHLALRERLAGEPQVGAAPDPSDGDTGHSASHLFEAGVQIQRWIPLGPLAVRDGQTAKHDIVAGRVAALAAGPTGSPLYAATANGGVYRSDDEGRSWTSLSDGQAFQLTGIAAVDSLACGAIAVDPRDPRRIYVGTGEGWSLVVVVSGVATTYLGIGPLSLDPDFGWQLESATPTLHGAAFFEMAADPWILDRVVGATNKGLYRREPTPVRGAFTWTRGTVARPTASVPAAGSFTSVVAVKLGFLQTRYYAVGSLGDVPGATSFLTSSDGGTWTELSPLPAVGVVRLAASPPRWTHGLVVYAMVSDGTLWRWSPPSATAPGGVWHPVGFTPALSGPLSYHLALAVSPVDPNIVYIGAGAEDRPPDFPASLFELRLADAASEPQPLPFASRSTLIGENVHADVHAILFHPADPSQLWAGTDGGVFGGRIGAFTGRNMGMSSLMMTRLGLHPTEPSVLYAGTQDNGTLLWTGELVWREIIGGDGGPTVVHRDAPQNVLCAYVKGTTYKSADGGHSFVDATVSGSNLLFYHQLVACDADPNLVASGGDRVLLSRSFGDPGSWAPIGSVLKGSVTALAFPAPELIYAGTNQGAVYALRPMMRDESGNVVVWKTTPLHDTVRPPWRSTWVTDVVVDPMDPSGNSVYISLAGAANRDRVWHYDGSSWTSRSGRVTAVGDRRLLDVQTSALVAIPKTSHLYAGTDVGVWWSIDGGREWRPCTRGLPQAAVVDLAYHPVSNTLLAATHGRGVYEMSLDPRIHAACEPWLRASTLDRRRRAPTDGHVHPFTGELTDLFHSPDIKVDVADANGFHVRSEELRHDLFDRLVDASDRVPTIHFAQPELISHVYVKANNGGWGNGGVRVILLVSCAFDIRPSLDLSALARLVDEPGAFTEIGDPFGKPIWRVAAIGDLFEVRADRPRVARFLLGSRLLPSAHELPGPGQGNGILRTLLAYVHPHAGSTSALRGEASLAELVRDRERFAAREIRVVRHDAPVDPFVTVPVVDEEG